MRKALTHLKSADPVLGGIIDRLGTIRIYYRPATFDALAHAIINQQLSGKAAATIYARLQAALAPKGVEPRGILKLGAEKLRGLGISAQKCSYLLDLAAKTRSREVDFDKLPTLSDEAVMEQLTAIKGIGVWTAHMFLIFALRRPDVLPSGDLGIQNAVQKAYGLASRPKPKQVEEIGAKWRPYASYAAWYLWRSLA
jgi:DNA-3-methyladenine glycosylase II